MLHLIVRSRNTSCKPLKDIIVPKRTILRLGSTTSTESIARLNHTRPEKYSEINTAKACEISGNKILMKRRFTRGRVTTAPWFVPSGARIGDVYHQIEYYLNRWKILIMKRKNSSKGKGIYLVKTLDDFKKVYEENIKSIEELKNYIVEKYFTYSREYRIHVTKDGYFLANRKMLINEAEDRWHRHANNSVWINEQNEMFDRPSNWDNLVQDCVNALKAVGLDIGAVDVKIQSEHNKKGVKNENPKWIILEINSAPALGEDSLIKYEEKIKEMINH